MTKSLLQLVVTGGCGILERWGGEIRRGEVGRWGGRCREMGREV